MTTPDQSPAARPSPRAPESPESSKISQSGYFYWELHEPEATREYEHASEEEGYLALDLIHGTKLLRTPWVFESCPRTVDVLPANTVDDVYIDAIATILQVAVANGYNAEMIARWGLEAQQSLRQESVRAAGDRWGRASLTGC